MSKSKKMSMYRYLLKEEVRKERGRPEGSEREGVTVGESVGGGGDGYRREEASGG